MKKRLLTFGLAIMLFAGALVGILISTSATEEIAFAPDSYDYEALYVEGALLNYSAMDHKAGDAVDPVLASTESGKQLLLSALNSKVTTDWTYGDGYLEISTGSQILASGIFTPGDATDSEKDYTVEYLYGTVDKGMPQTETDYATNYPKHTLYGSVDLTSYRVGSVAFTTHYIGNDSLKHLQELAEKYHACADSMSLQAGFRFEPNTEHASGSVGYEQTKQLIADYPAYYDFFNLDYSTIGASYVGKTVCNVGGAWKLDADWKPSNPELFRMSFGDVHQLNFLIKNTLNSDGTYAESAEIYRDFIRAASVSTSSFASEKLGKDLLLAKDIGARIYAVRVYERSLTAAEMQHNHVIDICRAYRLDPSFYVEGNQQDQDIYKTALANVRVGVSSKEEILELVSKAQASVLKTEKSEYTDLYVQEGLQFMVAPMITKSDVAEGDLITSVTDSDGNFYNVGTNSLPASFTDRAVNLGMMQNLDFGKILPEEGTYTVRIIYANHLAPQPSFPSSKQLIKFVIGPAQYRIRHEAPEVNPSAKSGVIWGYLNMMDGQSGTYKWKKDFDATWASGAKQPDLFAIDYGQIAEFTNEITIDSKNVTLNIYNGRSLVAMVNHASAPALSKELIIGSATNMDVYSVMIYDGVLTEEQKMQNHFADLMGYYQVDMTMFDKITNAAVKSRLYEALKDVKLGETSKDYLQSVLESFALTGGALGVIKVDDYMTFEGIQSRIEDYASARALFSFNTKKVAELEKIGCDVEIGTILMPVTEGSAMTDLTVSYLPALGEYAPADADAILKTFYRKGESLDGLYGFETDAKRYFSATIPELELTASSEKLNQQYYMRAYMAIDFDGSNFVLYTDAISDLFGDSVSIMEACNYFLFTGYAESDVLAALVGEYAATAAKNTLKVSLQAHDRYDIAAFASKLIQAARDGAQDAKNQNNFASAGISINMSEIDAMRLGPQAATTKVQAELYATIGIAKHQEASDAIKEARKAAEELYVAIFEEARAAGADEVTAEEIRAIACDRLLDLISDVENKLSAEEPLVDEMQAILDSFAGYTTLLQLSKVFPSKASLFINKLTVTRYTIVTDDEHLAIAEKLQKLLLEHVGNTVGVYNVDNKYVGSHYDYTAMNTIMLGLTENELRDSELSYAIYGDGKCIYIEGGSFEAVEAASAKFFKTYCSGTGRQQITIDHASNALLAQLYAPMVAFNYGEAYPAVKCDSYDADGVWQVFMQKMQELPEEITVLDTVEVENISDSLRNTYYVAVDGDDSNAGTIDAPFATLEAALEKVAYSGGDTIYLRGGRYELEKTVSVSGAHGGTLISPLYISAYPGEEVIFTSSKSISSSSLKTVDQAVADKMIDAEIKERLNAFSSDNSKNVYVTYLDPTLYDYGTVKDTRIYVDGMPSHVARWPNVGENDPENHIENGLVKFTDKGIKGYDKNEDDVLYVGKVSSNMSLLYDDYKDLVGGWKIVFDNCAYKDHILAYKSGIELYTYAAVFKEWHRSHYTLTLSVDEQGRNIMESKEHCQWGCREDADNNMYFYNAIEDLDSNDEYYLDRNTKMLFIYSDSSLEDKEILISSSETTLLNLFGVSNVVVNGITFTKTMATSLTLRDTDHVIIQNCTFSDITGSAVAIDGKYSGLLCCDLSNTVNAMVTLSSPTDTMTASYNFAQNCYFRNPNVNSKTGLTIAGVGTVVSHNLFEHTVVSYNDSLETILEYNEFDGGAQNTLDSGPVYLSGAGKKRNNHIRYNFIHNLNVSLYGVYLDDVSSGNYVYGNIIHYTDEFPVAGRCVNIHSGNMNVVYNNIGLNAGNAGITSNINYYVKSIDGKATGGGGMAYRWEAMSQRIVDAGFESELYEQRFPILYWFADLAKQHIIERSLNPAWSDTADKNSVADALELFLRSPSYNICVDNVMINCGEEGYRLADPLKNGIDERNLYFETAAEVGFVDYENGNFNLRGDSPVFAQNSEFFELPFDRMGRTVE